MAYKTILYLILIILSLPKIWQDPVNGIFVFVIMNYIRPEVISYSQLTPYRLPMVIAVFTLIAYVLNSKNRLNYRSSLNIIFFLFVLTQLNSTLFSTAESVSFYYNTVMMKIWLFTFLMTRTINTIKKFNWFIIANLIGIAFLSIWGFQQHFLGNARLEEVGGGNYANSNGLAAVVVQFIPIFIALSFVKKWKHKIILLFVSLIMVAVVVFTESRAAFLGVAIAGLILIIRSKKSFQFAIITLLLVGTFYYVALNVAGYTDRVDPNSMEKEKYSERVTLWKAAWNIGKDYPFTGVGQQNFQFYSARYITEELGAERVSFSRGDAHNTFLLILAEGGFLAFFLFLLMIFIFFKDIRLLRKIFKNNSEYIHLLTGLEAGMVAFLFANMFHSMAYMENLYWFLFVPSILKSIIIQGQYDDRNIQGLKFDLKFRDEDGG
jgi:putative inorganic carbon (HCO3(-)) transporter